MRCLSMIVVVALWTCSAIAGDLNPPPGPVAPTPGPEPRIPIGPMTTPGDADSTYKITQPGSYYLTGNLTGTQGDIGIEIASSHVSLDLNGFLLVGLILPGPSTDAIRVTLNNADGIVIRNGTVWLWGGDGIDASIARSVLIEDIDVSFVGDNGIFAASNATVRDCRAAQCGANGINVIGAGATIEGCSSRQNTQAGIRLSGTGTVRNCVAYLNSGDGFQSGSGANLNGCVSASNTGFGFDISTGVVTECVARANGSDGFNVFSRSVLRNCSAESNSGDQFEIGSRSTVEGCLATAIGAGIGFNVTGNGNRLDGNTSIDVFTHFLIDGEGNLVVRNHAQGGGISWTGDPDNDVATFVGSPNGAGAWANLTTQVP